MAASDPSHLVRAAQARGVLAPLQDSPLRVIAAGKAAWPMAHALWQLAGARVQRGLVAAPEAGRLPPPDGFRAFVAGHPSPDVSSVEAGQLALRMAGGTRPREWLVVLLSGGASAMLAVPAPHVTLDDKIAAAQALMHAGVSIDGLNCVRKHLSAIKGGLLGAAAPRSLTLAISDVHGPVADDLSVIASGPTFPDPTTFQDALDVVRDISGVPAPVVSRLERGTLGELPETVKPGDPRLAGARHAVIGNRRTALDGAEQAARARGYEVAIVPEATSGEAREAAHAFLTTARALASAGGRPLCVLAAGETTVRVAGRGKGGRNQEFALAATPLAASFGRAAVLASAGTDGTDGPTDAAGAVVDSSTLDRAQRAGVDWAASLADNDAYHFFEPLGDLIRWGPTGTNVGDLQVMLIA